MHASPSQSGRCSESSATGPTECSHTLRLGSSRRAPSIVSVDARGDVDASNADDLARYVTQVCGPQDDVVLDLRGVTFFGTHGLSVLMELILGRRSPVVVPSRPVERMLQLCDHESRVPVARDAEAAMEMVHRSA